MNATNDLSRLDGQSAVVTGGSKGIGLAIAHELVRRGADVGVMARHRGDLDAAVASLREQASADQRVHGFATDISDADDLLGALAEAGNVFPALNIFVANAGTGGLTNFVDLELGEWDRIMQVNLRGTFVGCQAVAKAMIDEPQENQAILVVSSIRAHTFRPGTLPYASTKAALNQFVRGAALELAPYRIRVNAVSPGMTVTPLMVERTPHVEELAAELIPFGRAAQAVDIARAAGFLCSPESAFVTGANLVVDGGESLR